MNYIYVLICPVDKEIRYVGTTKNPKERSACYTRVTDNYHNPRVGDWIIKLRNKYKYPEFKIIARCKPEIAKELEKRYIMHYSSLGTIFNRIHNPNRILI